MRLRREVLVAVLGAYLLSARPGLAADPRPLRFGIHLGMAASNFHGQLHDLAGLESRTQLTGGAFAAVRLSRYVALQPELNYVPRGAKTSGLATDVDGNVIGPFETHWDLKYLELPVLVRLTLPTEGRVVPSVYASPTLSYRLDAAARSEGPVGIIGSIPSRDLKNDTHAIDSGFSVGTGLEIGAGPGAVTLDGRYTFGLRNIFTGTGAANDKNRTL